MKRIRCNYLGGNEDQFKGLDSDIYWRLMDFDRGTQSLFMDLRDRSPIMAHSLAIWDCLTIL